MPVNYGHHRSDRIAEILSPLCGIRDEQIKKGVKPHDHARDNVLRIRAMQKLMAERKAAAAAEAAKPSPRKYATVGSRVAEQLSRPSTAEPRPVTPREPRNFTCPKPTGPAGRAFTAWAPPPLQNEGLVTDLPRRQKRNPPVPLREPPPPKPEPVDFVKRNAEMSALTPRKQRATPSSPGSPPGTAEKSKYHGRVPPYLLDRKLELARKAAAAEAAKAPRECPEGTRVLPEAERVETLAKVKAAQAKVNAELDKMPFVVDTFGLKQKHEALTKQLAQLAAAEAEYRSKVTWPTTPPPPRPHHALQPSLLRCAAEVLAVDDDEAEPDIDIVPEPEAAEDEIVPDTGDDSFTHDIASATALAQEAAALAEEVTFQHDEEQTSIE